MDNQLIFVKTPIGDEAVRQRTRVVKRNLRMVLVQVDGKLSVAELSTKIGNPQLVTAALRELESEGYIAPTLEGVSVWEAAQERAAAPVSEFSTFGPVSASADSGYSKAMASSFSSFGKSTIRKRPYDDVLPEPSTPVIVEKRVMRPDRKPVAWGRLGLFLILALLIGAVGTLFLYPYSKLIPGIEAAVSDFLKVPVKIESLQLSYYPKPALRLTNATLGAQRDISIETISLSPFVLIGSAKYDIQLVEVSGVSLAADRLLALVPFAFSVPATSPRFSVRQIKVDHLTVKAGSLHLDGLKGEISLRGDGTLEKSVFQTPDQNLRLSVVPGASGLSLDIEGFGWKPFSNQAVSFDHLQAKGLLQHGKLLIHGFDSTILGGVMKGNWMLDWSDGLAMFGDLTLARLSARKVSTVLAPKFLLDGEMAGALRFRSKGQDASVLWSNTEAELDFNMTNGILPGVDLGEVIRRGSGAPVRGGGTKFDRLTGKLNINPRQVSGRSLQLDAGMVAASGQFSVTPDLAVDASLTVTMQTSVAFQRMPVKVGGVLPDLTTMVIR